MSGIGKVPVRATGPRVNPPPDLPPSRGEERRRRRRALLPVASDVGEAPDALTLLLLPPFRGERRRRRGARCPASRPVGGGLSPPAPLPGGRTQDRGACGRRFLSSPLQGGGREGGPAPGCAGVPLAPREARTRMRAFGPPGRRDAGAPRRFTDERNREYPRPGCGAPWVNPPPDLPPSRGEERRPKGEERRRRRRALLPVDSDVGEAPDALTLLLLSPSGGEKAAAGRALPGVVAGGRRVIPPAPPFQGGGEKTQGGRREDGGRGARAGYPRLSRSIPVYPGLSRFISVYSGLSRFISVYSG